MQNKLRILKKNIRILVFIFHFSFFIFPAIGGSAFGGNSSSTNSLKTAQELFLRADYEGVIKECREELSASSRLKPEVRCLLALAYLKKGDLTQAEDNFLNVVMECKTLPICNKALLGLGDVYFLKEDYVKAQEFYLQANQTSSELGAQIYYRLAQVNLKLGDIEKAKAYSAALKREYPLSFEAQKDASFDNKADIFFSVQTGAFSSQKNALKLVSELKEKGFDAYVEPPDKASNALYRVRVGKFTAKTEAERTAQNLSEQGYPTKIFP